jgi:hypothetical protein
MRNTAASCFPSTNRAAASCFPSKRGWPGWAARLIDKAWRDTGGHSLQGVDALRLRVMPANLACGNSGKTRGPLGATPAVIVCRVWMRCARQLARAPAGRGGNHRAEPSRIA